MTALTLRHLILDGDSTFTVQVLMNGGFAGELREVAPDSPRITITGRPRTWASPEGATSSFDCPRYGSPT